MKVKRGGIYILSKEWRGDDNLLINRRPVLVLRTKADMVEAVFLGVIFAHSNYDNVLTIDVNNNGHLQQTMISCENILKYRVVI